MFSITALIFGSLILAGDGLTHLYLLGTLVITFISVFSLRAVYFALIEESHIARHVTGISVGIISVIGFTPDIFFAPLAGRLLDNQDTILGFTHFFILLTGISILGLFSAWALTRKNS